jgi:hypothetical protein
MTTQFDDVVKDAKQSAKEEIAEYLKRQNGSSTVIDKLIKAVSDIHQNKQLDEPTIQELLVLLSCIERLSDDLLAWAETPWPRISGVGILSATNKQRQKGAAAPWFHLWSSASTGLPDGDGPDVISSSAFGELKLFQIVTEFVDRELRDDRSAVIRKISVFEQMEEMVNVCSADIAVHERTGAPRPTRCGSTEYDRPVTLGHGLAQGVAAAVSGIHLFALPIRPHVGPSLAACRAYEPGRPAPCG